MQKIKTAIIGTGWITQVVHLPLLKKMSDVEIVAISDKDKAKAKSVGARFGIQRCYNNYDEMLKFEDISAVIICSSTNAHKEHSIAALENGKDVFVEKPLARTFAVSQTIVETANNHKRKLMVGMNNRFRPDVMALRSLVDAGELGKIFYIKAGWLKRMNTGNPWMTKKEKSGGGVFFDLGIAMLDLTLWLTNYSEVKRISSSMYHNVTKSVEDSCIVWCTLKNDTTICIEVSWSFPSEQDFFNCELIGTNGSASINPLRITKRLEDNILNLTPSKQESPQHQYQKSYENELKHFFGAIRGKHRILSTGEEAMHRMEIVDAIYRSAQTGKEQKFN